MSLFDNFGLIVTIIGIPLAIIGVVVFVGRNYIKVPPNVACVVVGRGEPRFVTSGAFFRLPLLHRVEQMQLTTFQVPVRIVDTPNKDGVKVTLEAVANLKISGDKERLRNSAERFLGKTGDEITAICSQTLEGMLRQLAGTLTIEEMLTDREKISQNFLAGAVADLQKLGVECDNFVITSVSDKEGYIDALGKTKTANVKRDAVIGQAEADREAMQKSSAAKMQAEKARMEAEQAIAQAARDLALRQASFKAETEAADATASLARAMQEAEITKDLKTRQVAIEQAEVEARTEVARKNAMRRQEELVAEKIRPAEAEREAAAIQAEGVRRSAVIRAEGEKAATIAIAEAERSKLEAEGEGRAAAEAAQRRQVGEAEAAASKARLLAEADGIKAKGSAEGAAISARLLAEAEGFLKKNQALSQMSESARLIFVIEALPEIIDRAGDAGQKVASSMFEAVGHGLSKIDNLTIMDMGGGAKADGSGPLGRFALTAPDVVFQTLTRAKALGLDIAPLLRWLKVDVQQPGHATDGAGSESKEPADLSS
jgi:flotillin